MKLASRALILILFGAFSAQLALADTADDVRKRGQLRCGVNVDLPGFSQRDKDGRWHGLDVDLCRAVAAAVVGSAEQVEYVPLTASDRWQALQSGAVDVLSRNSTWTMGRDLELDIEFVGTNYFDGQGFMVPASLQVRSALELDGSQICVIRGTTSEVNVKQYFALHRMQGRLHLFDAPRAMLEAFQEGTCTVMTSDQSQLYALRTELQQPANAVVLPEFISKEPLGPAVRDGDARWADIVQWTLFTMINAEELSITSANVDRVRQNVAQPALRRLLGLEGEWAERFGLDAQWAYRIIKQVGNYGESFERNVGKESPLQIRRGQNALWRDGGLLFAPPL